MRKVILVGAAMAISCIGMAASADRVMRTNVQCGNAFVTGFTVFGGSIDQYISNAAAEACGVERATAAGYTIVPASVDVWDTDEVSTYLASVRTGDFTIQLRNRSTCSLPNPDSDGGCFVDDGVTRQTTGPDMSEVDRDSGW